MDIHRQHYYTYVCHPELIAGKIYLGWSLDRIASLNEDRIQATGLRVSVIHEERQDSGSARLWYRDKRKECLERPYVNCVRFDRSALTCVCPDGKHDADVLLRTAGSYNST